MISRPEITAEVTEGVCRLLYHHQMACLTELRLGNGRRLDVLALGPKGDLWAVEVKSSVEDFRVDQKWQSYLDYCDRFYFAVPMHFPKDLIPEDVGLIVADRFEAAIIRPSLETKLSAARRKKLLISFGQTAATRLRGDGKDPIFVS
ncbi:MmcB family DNA repair protein [Thalassospira sp.]|uniref:MmcB family DNA repair protein n=1 Tax=Thalassospira sp. TaxID=1912094 RepID=UPI001B169D11|nr:MmcB family DNA repair protein [Thalassospira sp.]MBO6807767.1 MmcB family DNA repair protein [Thalassospira sp.]MBO6841023.1 MmcB family DNA repair protein [Thalassospira sp.]